MIEELNTRLKRIEMQKEYCWKNGLPYFASFEICPRCCASTYDYVSDDEAANTLITGCPICHYSFCE